MKYAIIKWVKFCASFEDAFNNATMRGAIVRVRHDKLGRIKSLHLMQKERQACLGFDMDDNEITPVDPKMIK